MRQPDLEAFLEYLRELYAQRDLEGFKQHVATSVSSLVGSESATYNEVDLKKQKLSTLYDPVPPNVAELTEFFNNYKTKHPLFNSYLQTGDGSAVKISDLLTLREFRRLEVYEAHRQAGVHHAMAIGLQGAPHILTGIALGRSVKDFSERERLLLDLLRPHLRQAYDNAAALTRLQQKEPSPIGQTVEEPDRGVVVLEKDGRVRWCTERTGRWLSEYFEEPSRNPKHLPDDLRRWVDRRRSLLSGGGGASLPHEPLVVKRAGKRLVVRFLTASLDGRYLLVLEERREPLSAGMLEGLGLSPRESEVLACAARGMTNKEIGAALYLSPLTVKTHLERVYRKLGVEGRAAAIYRASELL